MQKMVYKETLKLSLGQWGRVKMDKKCPKGTHLRRFIKNIYNVLNIILFKISFNSNTMNIKSG